VPFPTFFSFSGGPVNFDTIMLGVVIVATILICVSMWMFPSLNREDRK
jgi:hypothetical protein